MKLILFKEFLNVVNEKNSQYLVHTSAIFCLILLISSLKSEMWNRKEVKTHLYQTWPPLL